MPMKKQRNTTKKKRNANNREINHAMIEVIVETAVDTEITEEAIETTEIIETNLITSMMIEVIEETEGENITEKQEKLSNNKRLKKSKRNYSKELQAKDQPSSILKRKKVVMNQVNSKKLALES
jgi:hypothetical protein